MEHKNTKPTAIEKALDILLAFTPNNPDMGTVELSQKTGFHTATVNRTLKALTGKKFLYKNPITRKFSLGPAIFALGEAVLESVSQKAELTARLTAFGTFGHKSKNRS